jgi:16S rRNA (uracil1498-N3)-methyltransferase
VRRRFFVERFTHGTAKLEGEAAHHLGRVLRAAPGQVYELSDGAAVFLARIEKVGRDSIEFVTLEPVAARAPRLRPTLLLAVVKFDHFEWALEKAVELGVETIVPLAAERSEKALIAAAAKRAARWRKILLESAQQARCLSVPRLEEALRPSEAFAKAAASIRILLSERPEALPLRAVLEREASSHSATSATNEGPAITLAVGPEGGWTDAEFSQAASSGFLQARLGDNILRTETAVVAGLAAAHLYFDDTSAVPTP